MSESTVLDCLPSSLSGAITPDSPDYEEARKLYNAMIDKRPAAILRCRTAREVAEAVNAARAQDMLLAIRGGGHNGPGLGSCDGGLVIDLSPMNQVEVDPEKRIVRAGGGCTQGEVDRVASAYGLAVPAGIVSSTGIGGLTLGGGHGYLTRKYGLTIDNLIEAEVVLADGSIVTASSAESPDLFWAIRGGGGNFGVVTRFTYRAHPVRDVFAGPIFYDVGQAAEIMRFYRDFLPTAPRELAPFFGMKKVPSTDPFPRELWGRPVAALIACFNGSEADGREAMAPVHEALPEPLMDGMAMMPFVDWQAAFDGLLPKGLQWYWKGDFVNELTDAAIEEHVRFGSNTPSELSLMHLYPIDGAVSEVAPEATAWGAREATWSMVIAGIDPDPAKAEELKRWGRSYWQAVHAHNPHGGAYVNFLYEDEDDGRIEASYGPNYERLRQVKQRYDPSNLFRVNQNIKP
jgi:FAD/FMN-containing dehydrogenase